VNSIPRDDLALALMEIRRIEQIAAAPPHQKFRTPGADRIVPPPAAGRLAGLVFRQLRKCEDLAPHLPGRRDFLAVGTSAKRNAQGGIAMNQNQHLRVVDAAQGDAEKIADANVDCHPHAVDGAMQDDAFAVKFDFAHAAIGARIMRVEADGQRERVEPQGAARPGGIEPACCCLTPHGFISPPGLCSRSMGGP
jgi:hypothetical protein